MRHIRNILWYWRTNFLRTWEIQHRSFIPANVYVKKFSADHQVHPNLPSFSGSYDCTLNFANGDVDEGSCRDSDQATGDDVERADVASFVRFLHRLRAGKSCQLSYTLLQAPQLAYRLQREREFAELVGEWWQQFRSYVVDHEHELKYPSYLIHLGKLHRYDDGKYRILKKIGGLNDGVAVFLKQMIDVGIHRYSYGDINSALTGLRDFLAPFDRSSRRSFAPPPVFYEWLSALEDHLRVRQREDIGQTDRASIVSWGASSTLALLKQILKDPPPDSLLRVLCELCVEGFRNTVAQLKCGEERSLGSQNVSVSDLSNYAGSWYQWRMNPDCYAASSVEWWFKAFYAIFQDHQNRSPSENLPPMSLYCLSSFPSMGSLISTSPSHGIEEDFVRCFFTWQNAVRRCLDQPVSLTHLSMLVFGIGSLCELKQQQLHSHPYIVDGIVDVLERCDQALPNALISSQQNADLFRTLKGLRHCLPFMAALGNVDNEGFPTIPAPGLLALIDRFCDSHRTSIADRSAHECWQIAETVSTVLFLLQRVSRSIPPSLVLKFADLLTLCMSREVTVSTDRLSHILCYCGGTFCRLQIDPTRSPDRFKVDFLEVWSSLAELTLQRLASGDWKSRTDHKANFLTIVVTVIENFRLQHCFYRLMPYWQQSLRGCVEELNSRQAFYLLRHLDLCTRQFGVASDNALLVMLKSVAAKHRK